MQLAGMFVKALPNDVTAKIEAALARPLQTFVDRQKQAIAGQANPGLPDFTERLAEDGICYSRFAIASCFLGKHGRQQTKANRGTEYESFHSEEFSLGAI